MNQKNKQYRYRITRRNLFKVVGGLGLTAIFANRWTRKANVVAQGRNPTTLSELNSENTPASSNLSKISPIEFEFETVTTNENGQIKSQSRHQAYTFSEDIGAGLNLNMVSIPGGVFQMGSPPAEPGNFTKSERPQHRVSVPSFYMAMYPTTQMQWRTIATLPKVNIDLHPDPSYFKGDDLPVEQISWYDAVEFCARLSRYTGKNYRLPSEAEWEYACRARTTTPFYFGPTITSQIANYYAEQYPYAVEPEGEYRQKTTPVGRFPPNAFGIYDLHGNVYEWCADFWHKNYKEAPDDASIWNTKPYQNGRYRVLRGGSWSSEARHCRSAKRNLLRPSNRYSVVGFRIVTA